MTLPVDGLAHGQEVAAVQGAGQHEGTASLTTGHAHGPRQAAAGPEQAQSPEPPVERDDGVPRHADDLQEALELPGCSAAAPHRAQELPGGVVVAELLRAAVGDHDRTVRESHRAAYLEELVG